MISLLIPTINRSDFILKYLSYLNENGFKGEVLIGDSSEDEHFKITENFISSLASVFTVKQFSYPNMMHFEVIRKMLPYITMPYCMYICDDDILIVDTLKKCISFLEKNPKYSGVGGLAIACEIDENDYSKILSTRKYNVAEINDMSSTHRIDNLMSSYSVIVYSLARTNQFIERWPIDSKFNEKGIAIEILPCAVLAAQGKVKHLDELFVVRQMHGRRIILPHMFDTIKEPEWGPSTDYAIDYLSTLVMRIDSISFELAYDCVKRSWKKYFITWFNKNYNQSQNIVPIWKNPKIRFTIKSFPGVMIIYRILRSFYSYLGIYNDLSLNGLLRPSSKYHNDFYSVYKTITSESKK